MALRDTSLLYFPAQSLRGTDRKHVRYIYIRVHLELYHVTADTYDEMSIVLLKIN